MPSLDYRPGQPSLVPDETGTRPLATGAGTYGTPTAATATPGTDSVTLAQSIADEIGVTTTDGAAVLKWVIDQNFVRKTDNT